MGYSSPKKPFDLTEFLSQPGKPPFSRKPSWNRRPAMGPKAVEAQVKPTAGPDPDPV
jgi:hypothetical protein